MWSRLTCASRKTKEKFEAVKLIISKEQNISTVITSTYQGYIAVIVDEVIEILSSALKYHTQFIQLCRKREK